MNTFLQTLIYGLATGSVIAVAAVGLTLSFGVTRFINFAYGETLTIAAYVCYGLVGAGAPLAVGILVALAAGGVVSWIVARLAFEPLRRRGALALLITSVGVAFVLQNVVQIVATGKPVAFPLPLLSPWHIGTLFVPKLQAIIFAVACVTMVLVHLLLRRTQLGRTMRAVASNDTLTRLSGVNTRGTVAVAWIVSGVIAGLAGVLLAASQGSMTPTFGFSFLLLIFSAAMLGGIGQPYGAMAGALIIGMGVEFGATYISADYSNALAFGALVVVLLARPQGLFGRKVLSEEMA